MGARDRTPELVPADSTGQCNTFPMIAISQFWTAAKDVVDPKQKSNSKSRQAKISSDLRYLQIFYQRSSGVVGLYGIGTCS